MPRTSSDYDLELIDGSGNVTGLMLARPRGLAFKDSASPLPLSGRAQPGDGTPISLSEMIDAVSADAQLTKRLVPAIHVNSGGGLGVDYNAAEGVYSRTPGWYGPAGAVTTVTLPAGGITSSKIVAIAEFGGDVWFLYATIPTHGGRVVRCVGGAGNPVVTTFNSGNTYLPVGETGCDLIVATNGAGVQALYLSSTTEATPQGHLYRWDPTLVAWTAPLDFGANTTMRRLAKVHWTTQDGAQGWRMVAIAGAGAAGVMDNASIAYTKPDTDPMLIGSWITGVRLGTAFTLLELVGSRHHVYATAQDGLFDLDGLGNSPNLTSYLADEIQTGTGTAAVYHNGYVYMSVGRGVERIYVGQNGQLQEEPGQCAPGWGTPAENIYRGYATAFCTDQGYVPVAIHNPSSKVSGIFWGLDRAAQGSLNPLRWYGPEMICATDYQVTRMKTSGAAGDLRLWIAVQSVAGLNPVLMWMSLPVAGSPLQDLLSLGSQKFATGNGPSGFFQPYVRLSLMADTVGDEISTKILDRNSAGSRGLSVNAGSGADDGFGTKLTIYSRADPDPGSTAWGTGVDVTKFPTQTVLPAAATSGHRLESRVDFLSPQGGAATPKLAILTSLRRDVWRIAPDIGVITPAVVYGPGILTLNGLDERDPDDVTTTLRALMQQGRITLRDRQDKKWVCKLEQVSQMEDALHEQGFGKTVHARLELSVLGSA